MERNIYRHSSDKGSVIEFDMYGKAMKLFVPDAKYRPPNAVFGHHSIKRPDDHYFALEQSYTDMSNAVNDNVKLPRILGDAELQSEFWCFNNDLTAKQHTDILMQEEDTDAAHACRNLDVGLGPMDLPNIYELMVIYQEADTLDAMDPTFSDNKDKGLGYKSTYGRFNSKNNYELWSSTAWSYCYIRVLTHKGFVGNIGYYSTCRVLPILEI